MRGFFIACLEGRDFGLRFEAVTSNQNLFDMTSKRRPNFNAGSTADIAFLLLVFFLLVTTMQSELGLTRKLPRWVEDTITTGPVSDRNLLAIYINQDGAIMVKEEVVDLDDLNAYILNFVDNNGDGSCTYCKGESSPESSDNPKKAVISISSNRSTSYADYISVQNEIARAFRMLREDMAKREYETEWAE